MTQVFEPTEKPTRPHEKSSAGSMWRDYPEYLLLVGAFVGGVAIRFFPGASVWLAGWNWLFIALGAVCLGFGAGMLFYRGRFSAETSELRRDYAELRERAGALALAMDAYARKRNPNR